MPIENWNGDEFLELIREQLDERLGEAAAVVEERQKQLVSTPYPPASMRGEPPHKRTGKLEKGIHVYRPTELVRQIGSSAPYTAKLEKELFRPFLIQSLMDSLQDIRNIMFKGDLSSRVSGVSVTPSMKLPVTMAGPAQQAYYQFQKANKPAVGVEP